MSSMEDKLASLFRRVRRLRALRLLGDLFSTVIADTISISTYFFSSLEGPYRLFEDFLALGDTVLVRFAGRHIEEYLITFAGLNIIYDAFYETLSSVGNIYMGLCGISEGLSLSDSILYLFNLGGSLSEEILYHIEVKLPELFDEISKNLYAGLYIGEDVSITEALEPMFRLSADLEDISEILHILIKIFEDIELLGLLYVSWIAGESISVMEQMQITYFSLVREVDTGIELSATVMAWLIETLEASGTIRASIRLIDDTISLGDSTEPLFRLQADIGIGVALSSLASATQILYEAFPAMVGKLYAGLMATESLGVLDQIVTVDVRLSRVLDIVVVVIPLSSTTSLLTEPVALLGSLIAGITNIGESITIADIGEPLARLQLLEKVSYVLAAIAHSDSYSDWTDHVDWTDSHSDAHQDWYDIHTDSWSDYSDSPYVDEHSDSGHTDEHDDWTDDPYGDHNDHGDWTDEHSDSYSDWTNIHTDNWTDHSDSPWYDEHADSGHTDDYTDWSDAHVDWTDYTDWTDEHTDNYADWDNIHTDNWTDHSDSPWYDEHTDSGHTDTHVDWSDAPYDDHQDHDDWTDQHYDAYQDHDDSHTDDWTDHGDSPYVDEHTNWTDHDDWTDSHNDHDDWADYSDSHGDHTDSYADWDNEGPHQDWDDYTDNPWYNEHTDSGHTDTYWDWWQTPYSDHIDWGDSHWDNYADWDNVHTDSWTDHDDDPWYDEHTDSGHSDTHTDWSDGSHQDHQDHDDSYSDHDDGYLDWSNIHTDSWNDYSDNPWYDEHTDSGHSDSPYDDHDDHDDWTDYSDTHGDHTDSYADWDNIHTDDWDDHGDSPYVDEHADSGHTDDHDDWTDDPYGDHTDHADWTDEHFDNYADWTNIHTDDWDDHGDSPWYDEHSDVGHTDDHDDWGDVHQDWTDYSDWTDEHTDNYSDWWNIHTDDWTDHSDEPYVDDHDDVGHTDDHDDWTDDPWVDMHFDWSDYYDTL